MALLRLEMFRYAATAQKAIRQAQFTDQKGAHIDTNNALNIVADTFEEIRNSTRKIIFIGNGGSAAICAHMAEDYTKCGGMRSVCFNDGPLLLCLGNDYSFEQIFEKTVQLYGLHGDILVAISSSGKSKNILNAAIAAKKIPCKVVTFSGFHFQNPLSKLGDINCYIPTDSFGITENAHQMILHFLLDHIVERSA